MPILSGLTMDQLSREFAGMSDEERKEVISRLSSVPSQAKQRRKEQAAIKELAKLSPATRNLIEDYLGEIVDAFIDHAPIDNTVQQAAYSLYKLFNPWR
jgi:flagellar motor switch protein FliG